MTFIPHEAQYLTQMASDEHRAGKHCCGDLLSVEDQAYDTKEGALTTVLRAHFNNDNGRLCPCYFPLHGWIRAQKYNIPVGTSTCCVVSIYH